MASRPGYPPLPANVRILRGGKKPPSARGIPKEKEVVVPVGIPAAPKTLSEAEREVFDHKARQLAGMRVMTEVDTDALAIYARNFCMEAHARAKLEEEGRILTSPSGYRMPNPWEAIRRRAEDKCIKILQEFGMTPSSRVRVSQI